MATANETPLLTPKHGFVLPCTRCGRKKAEIVVEDATGPGLSGAKRSGPTLLALPTVRDLSNPSRSSCNA